MTTPILKPVGDRAVLVELDTTASDETQRQIWTLDRVFAETQIVGVTEIIPALVNLLVVFDPMVTTHRAIEEAILDAFPLPDHAANRAQVHTVPVCFDPTLTPDLAEVAKTCGTDVDSVVQTMLSVELTVSMYGFAPGYAYLTGLPKSVQVPRKPRPVAGVPKGSVIIAGPQCLITPLKMPTGWSIIGRTPFTVMDPTQEDPFRLSVGDMVTFTPIGTFDLPSDMQTP